MSAAQTSVATVRWVVLAKYCEVSGETPGAVRKRREKGQWLDGTHTAVRNRRLWVNLDAAQRWALQFSDGIPNARAALHASEVELSEIAERSIPFSGLTPAVYFLFQAGELVYIGQSNHVYGRLAGHVPGVRGDPSKPWDRVTILEVPADELVLLEGLLIHRFRPPYNTWAAPRLVRTEIAR